MSAERAREREVHRYYQTWLESFLHRSEADKAYLADSYRNDGTEVKSSRDKALVAFAQLGCMRLNVKRGVISLISSSQQYVIAEATRTIFLVSDQGHAVNDELWFGEASLPRSQGVSEYALHPESYTAQDEHGDSSTSPAFVVNDISADSRFSNFQYSGKGVSFYAGVPIVSRTGFNIGVFAVSDDQPRNSITPNELRFMKDMAIVVLDHLDVIRSTAARYRGERMVEGLGCFVEGRQAVERVASTITEPLNNTTVGNSQPGNVRGQFKGMTISDTDVRTLRNVWNSENEKDVKIKTRSEGKIIKSLVDLEKPPLSRTNSPAKASGNPPDVQFMDLGQGSSVSIEIRQIFGRAANILRESTVADGVVFHDATSINRGRTSVVASLDQLQSDTSTSDESINHSTEDLRSSPVLSRHSSSSSEDTGWSPGPRTPRNQKLCQMLGFSFNNATVAPSKAPSVEQLALTKHNLSRLIRRYPRGKIFHYEQDGQVSSSEGDESSQLSSHNNQTFPTQRPSKSTEKKGSSRAIAEELLKVAPGARNVIFLPLWDFNQENWSAGCFVWSRRPEQLLTAQDDLTYLKTFGNSIMSEVARMGAILSDRARTSFLANISHDLRTPLHGILGSIEFLQNTSFDPFQSAMITTVETCGRTLLDTINHVLDYAKINQLSNMSQKNERNSRNTSSRRPVGSTGTDSLTTNFDLAVNLEEVVEATYAGQTFKSAGAFHHAGDEDDSDNSPALVSDERSSHEKKPLKRQLTESKFLGAVRLTLDIERLPSWTVRAQPGAIRRIVMNLLGNSLKYTEKGFIRVSLKSALQKRDDPLMLPCCITVEDSGRGMSLDFVKHHAFSAFTQEDSFSSGTGLGLSIVSQIVRSLGGKIDLKSQKGVGTEANVWLNLPIAQIQPNPHSFNVGATTVEQTRNRKLCLVAPDYSSEDSSPQGQEIKAHVENSIRHLARDWFGMDVFNSATMKNVDADFFLFAEPPSIKYLEEQDGGHVGKSGIPLIIINPNAFERASVETQGFGYMREFGPLIEVISQPVGPQKFERTLHRSLEAKRKLFKSQNLLDDSVARRESERAAEPAMNLPKEVNKSPAHEAKDPLSDASQQSPRSDSPHSSGRPQTSSGLKTSPAYSIPGSNSSESGIPSSKGPALLVDDNDVNLKLLVAFVRKGGFPYEQAVDGQQAVEAYKAASTDPAKAFKYVCMDITMPVMDGLTAAREIRVFEKKNSIPPARMIALTGLASERAQRETFESGFDEYLHKPVRFKDLLDLLDR